MLTLIKIINVKYEPMYTIELTFIIKRMYIVSDMQRKHCIH